MAAQPGPACPGSSPHAYLEKPTGCARTASRSVAAFLGVDPTNAYATQTNLENSVEWKTDHGLSHSPNNFPVSGPTARRGLPDFPGTARRPKAVDTYAAKAAFPNAKFPFVARRISSTRPSSNSNLNNSRYAAARLAASLPSAWYSECGFSNESGSPCALLR